MESNNLDPSLMEQLRKLQQKCTVMGQDLSSYLDGLLYADYLTYWDYIHLDTLLSLQSQKTQFPDEKIFIVYHQITELYFNLILWEIEQVTHAHELSETFFIDRMDRVLRYFRHLENSFAIMTDGMEKEQFLKFRMALLPASGFQSAQYRLIEITSTDMINLVGSDERSALPKEGTLQQQLEKLYWRRGATELASGKKTFTLKQFEDKYMSQFLETGSRYKDCNLRKTYLKHFPQSPEVIKTLRDFDELANVLWPMVHMKSAVRYLQKASEDIKATGGTNWQKYLPPRFQKIMFFPELWSDQEKAQWGKAGVMHSLASVTSSS